MNELMTERQAGDFLQVTCRTMQAWRGRGGGPKYVKISGKCIRYRQADLDAWIAQRLVSSTAEPTEAEKAATAGPDSE